MRQGKFMYFSLTTRNVSSTFLTYNRTIKSSLTTVLSSSVFIIFAKTGPNGDPVDRSAIRGVRKVRGPVGCPLRGCALFA